MFYVIALATIAFILNLPTVKGFFGELFIRLILKFLDKEKYMVINDVMLPTKDGRTAQIDHVVVSRYGVFVIETKNYSGWIFGSENSRNWTQVIYKTKNQFYNPIMQNKGHIKALRDLLYDYPDIKYIPIVVFTMKANFKKLEVVSHVVYSLGLLNIMKSYTEEIIMETNVVNLYKRIVGANNTDKVARKEHVENIRNYKYKTEIGICPRCGGNLVERHGRYGTFIGCSNYPRCKFILKDKK